MMGKTKTTICLVAEVAVIAGMAGYYFWTTQKSSAARESRAIRHGLITGIIYTEEDPSALIGGEIVHEGDTIHGVQVVKIHRDKIEFEKKKKKWTQQIREGPSRAWPKKTD
jgi:hypothetical protein